MGHDKALLSLPTEGANPLTLLQQTCDVAHCCGGPTYVLTPWPERYRSLLSVSVVLLREMNAGGGPMVALAQGWTRIMADSQRQGECSPDWLLVLACDMPALDRSILQTWQQELTWMKRDAIAALPRQNNRWEPLCGFYHRRCIPSLHKALQGNVRSFQPWLDTESVLPLSIENPSNMLRNCNTPQEWQAYLTATKTRNL